MMHRRSILCRLVLLCPFLLVFHHQHCTTTATRIVDLSQPWEKDRLYNRNKAYCNIQSSMHPKIIQGWVIVQDGRIVAEGHGYDHDENDLFRSYSTTKNFATMLIGKMVELQLVYINETLGDIFNNTSDWEGVSQATEKQTVTLEELLTMTSGLVSVTDEAIQDQETLQQVLQYMEYQSNQRGKFNYLGSNNILSRIIYRRSGKTPLPFAQHNLIFDKLGIPELWIQWGTFGGVEGSAYGLNTTPRTLAKLGQLYLQNGLAAEGDQLISSDWIQASTTDQLADDTESVQPLFLGYGYQWYVDRTVRDDMFVPLPQLTGAYAGQGALGQQIVVIPDTDTVIAIMSDDATYVYSYAFFATILQNLDKLGRDVDEPLKCDDFSLWSFGIRGSLGVMSAGWKVLINCLF
ncbi:Beta-lactamase [Seminavis robusta]|uniref:Beta-lactamase n=1 Tax=Seminavis robusta TaxID=568900 RepID=A0A9N8HF19_9STRA|nr:Beta-lactamase [Seminavis robusta]|eukprot:Sro503_g155730.1 Beta-lactamase (405) ;mRNA; f:7550-8764